MKEGRNSRGTRGGDGLEAVFDEAEMTRQMMCDRAFMVKALQIFFSQTEELMAQMRKGMETGDPKLVHGSAHTLKGSAQNVSAHRMTRLAMEIETFEGDLDSVAPIMDALGEEISAFQKAVTYAGLMPQSKE